MKHALIAFALVACSRSAEVPTTAEAPDPKAPATSPLAGVDEIVTATVDVLPIYDPEKKRPRS